MSVAQFHYILKSRVMAISNLSVKFKGTLYPRGVLGPKSLPRLSIVMKSKGSERVI